VLHNFGTSSCHAPPSMAVCGIPYCLPFRDSRILSTRHSKHFECERLADIAPVPCFSPKITTHYNKCPELQARLVA